MGSGLKALEPHALLAVGLFVAVQFPACLMGVETALNDVRSFKPSFKLSLATGNLPPVNTIRREDAWWADCVRAKFAKEPVSERLYNVLDTLSFSCFDHSKLGAPLFLGTIKCPLILSDVGRKEPRNKLCADPSENREPSGDSGGDVFWTHFRIRVAILAFIAGAVAQLLVNIFLR